MNGNQGLEALAALCGGEAAVATGTDANSSNSSSNNHAKPAETTAGTSAQPPQSPQQQQQPVVQVQAPVPTQQQGADALTRQQWQQAVAAAAALGAQGNVTAGAPAATGLTAQGLALLSAAGLQPAALQQQQQQQPQPQQQQQQQQPQLDSNAALAAMQQLAYFRYIQEQATAAVAKIGQNAAAPNVNMNPLLHSNPQAVALALAGQAQQLQQHLGDAGRQQQQQQVLPPAAAPSSNPSGSQPDSSSSSVSSMPPPPSGQAGVTSIPSINTTAAAPAASRQHTAIAPLPNSTGVDGGAMTMTSPHDGGAVGGGVGVGVILEDKKLQKRAANRRSAQLSRKRKKQFIEELKDENDELRRKEQILRSIPDLIVVFDSTGKLWFVSQSVSRFMNMTAQELEGTSFWDRLCEDSVRLLKAAFMDSLAARTDESDTAPLGSGIWELRLVDKDGSYKVVTLNGVVHFSGDRPECVCSIRPRDDMSMPPKRKQRKAEEALQSSTEKQKEASKHAVSSESNGSNESATTSSLSKDSSNRSGAHFQPLIRAKPQQSVISNSTSSSSGASARINQKVKAAAAAGSGKRREAARISDGDSGSADSGSSDELGE